MANPQRVRNVQFKTQEIKVKSRTAMTRALDTVAQEIETKYKDVLGVQGSPGNRSKPGQAPKRQTGRLQDNVKVTRRGRTLIVKTLQYGIWLDGGTRAILPRPWLRKALHDRKKFWVARINTLQRRFMNQAKKKKRR